MNSLNSDQLREKLHENAVAMNALVEQNDLITDLLKQRGLQAVEPDMGIKIEMPLTAEELERGKWWMDSADKDDAAALKLAGVTVYRELEWPTQLWPKCEHNGSIAYQTRITSEDYNQIHRAGNHFYWGAPE